MYQPSKSEEPVEGPIQLNAAPRQRRLRINIPTSEDADADIARLRQIFDVLRQFPGEDEVHLVIVSSEGVTKLEVPHLGISYCPELRRQLVELISEKDVILEES